MIYDGKAISVLSMFLLGALIGKLGLYRNVSGHRKLFRNVFWICAPVGVVGNAVLTPIHAATPDFPPTGMWVIENCLYAIAVPAMAIAYASGFAWLRSSGWRSILSWTASAGRMALTTYLSQTLIGVALFYGVGLRLRGQVGLVEGTILAIGIFAMQCVIAVSGCAGFYLARSNGFGAGRPTARRSRCSETSHQGLRAQASELLDLRVVRCARQL
jgi:uncharacterized protein